MASIRDNLFYVISYEGLHMFPFGHNYNRVGDAPNIELSNDSNALSCLLEQVRLRKAS